MKSDNFESYRDSSLFLQIDKLNKRIFIRDVLLESLDFKEYVKKASIFNDSLFKHLRIRDCKDKQINGESFYNVFTYLDESSKSKTPFQEIVFLISKSSNQLRNIYIKYSPEAEYVSCSVWYKYLKIQPGSMLLPKPLTNVVFERDGKTSKKEFKQYAVTDLRRRAASNIVK